MKTEMGFENAKEITKQESLNRINEITQEVSARGANGSEIHELLELKKLVVENKIGPEIGLKEAQQILDSKQDYH
jgi:hypothetical protein